MEEEEESPTTEHSTTQNRGTWKSVWVSALPLRLELVSE